MEHFRRVLADVDPTPFLAEVTAVDDAFALQTGRQRIRVQREALAIPIRGIRRSRRGGRARRDVHASRWTGLSARLPITREFLEWFAAREDGLLGRAKIVCLPAGRRVHPHVDRGEYYRLRDRYHLVLRSTAGSWLRAGGEEVRMREGELWWFDNKQTHEASNDGDEDRIHLIFDVLPGLRAAIERRERALRRTAVDASTTAESAS